MRALTFRPDGSTQTALDALTQAKLRDPRWFLLYTAADTDVSLLMAAVARAYPHVPVFGASSFRGTFSPAGFSRDSALLIGEREDGLQAELAFEHTTTESGAAVAQHAADTITRRLGRKPDVFLLHATPGHEERLLEGVRASAGTEVPVYGGSAADDHNAGRWRVFANGHVLHEGMLLVGLTSPRPILKGFAGGYLPTEHSGVVTRAAGRLVHEIEGRPAAEVYNEWTSGAIACELARGGNILLKSNAMPLARVVGQGCGMPRRLLSHPEAVSEARGLRCYSEFVRGDHVTLMTSSEEALVERVHKVVERARRGHGQPVRGGLLIYCAGCLGMLLDRAPQIAREFQLGAGNVPFVGAATFGEQGAFFEKSESLHGNLMCGVLLF